MFYHRSKKSTSLSTTLYGCRVYVECKCVHYMGKYVFIGMAVMDALFIGTIFICSTIFNQLKVHIIQTWKHGISLLLKLSPLTQTAGYHNQKHNYFQSINSTDSGFVRGCHRIFSTEFPEFSGVFQKILTIFQEITQHKFSIRVTSIIVLLPKHTSQSINKIGKQIYSWLEKNWNLLLSDG